jgi:hypothetical protein
MISEEHHALAQTLAEQDRKLGDFEAGGAIFDAYGRRYEFRYHATKGYRSQELPL